MLILSCINFEHLFALIYSWKCKTLYDLLNVTVWPVSPVCSLLIPRPPPKSSENLKVFNDFRVNWKKTLERNGLILPRDVFHEVRTKCNADFWNVLSLFAYMHTFGLPPTPTYNVYVICFANQPPTTT